jgi:hypothetical protein
VTSKRERQARAQAMNAQAQARRAERERQAERALRLEAAVRDSLAERRGARWLVAHVKAQYPQRPGNHDHATRFDLLCAI